MAIDDSCPRPGRQMKVGGLLPKTGSVQAEWRRCGKPACRCTRGTPHGPYWYLRWREDGRQRRRYVSREQLNALRESPRAAPAPASAHMGPTTGARPAPPTSTGEC